MPKNKEISESDSNQDDSGAEKDCEKEDSLVKVLVLVRSDGKISTFRDSTDSSLHLELTSAEQDIKEVVVDRQNLDFALLVTDIDEVICLFRGNVIELSDSLKHGKRVAGGKKSTCSQTCRRPSPMCGNLRFRH